MDEQCEYEERFIDRMQEWLDAGMGVRHMRRSDVRKLLGRKSTFWMGESYDHIVRDVKELAAFRNYIGGNPAKAGLEPTEYSLQLRNVLMP
jgi:hypothetical protein